MKKISLLILFVMTLYGYAGKKALIFGVTGQDGSYLSELLLEKGYEVHGVTRGTSSNNTSRINHLYQDWNNDHGSFFLHQADLVDGLSIVALLQKIHPDEIYNLAAQSDVKLSFDISEYTADVDALGVLRILEAIRSLGWEDHVKFYQASTSELYGCTQESPQKESTPFHPRSPYGVAKLYGYWITKQFREAYGLFCCNGILYNHESPRRGEKFLTRKVSQAVARIHLGIQDVLYIGNLDAKRDWGHAKDYVEGMWMMLQKETPEDYILATCEAHSVREFIERAFEVIGIHIVWQGTKENEVGVNKATGKIFVKIDPVYYRPVEPNCLVGDYSKAKKELGWEPKTRFNELVQEMVVEDIKLLQTALK